MKCYEVETSIDSGPEQVWAVLTDLAAMPDLGPSFTQFAAGLKSRVEALNNEET